MIGKRESVGRKIEPVIDVIGEILGFLTVVLIVLILINNVTGNWLGDALPTLLVIREYAILVTLAVVGLEFVLKRGFFVFLIYAVIVAAGVILMFFPGAWPWNVM